MYILAQNISNYIQVFPFFSFSRKACLLSLKTDVVLRPIANLKTLRAANTNPANLVLHEIPLIVVKGFSKDLVPFWTARAIHSKKNCHQFMATRSKKKCHGYDSGYLFEKKLSSVWIARAIGLENYYPFKRLTTFRNTPLLPQPFVTNLAYLVVLSILYHDLMNFHVTFSAE